MEALGDRRVDRVHLQREIRGQHHRRVPLRRIMSVRDGVLGRRIRGSPLLRAGGARRQLPLVLEQVVQVAVVPRDRVGGPRALEAARHRVGADAGTDGVVPTQALRLDGTTLGLQTDVVGTVGAMALAERVATDDQRHRLLVVHRHPAERLADVTGRRQRVRVAVRALRVDVDEAHLHRSERVGQLAVAAVALVAQPRVLGTPEDLVGLPGVGAPEAEAERLEPHRLEGDVAGEDEEVGPRELAAVLLLDRPEQPARLVEAGVVGPAVERREALRPGAATAATVGDAVRAGGMPGHADEQRPVMAVVGRPPVLRRRHHLDDVLLQRVEIEGLELLRVVEVLAQRVGPRRRLMKHLQVELIRPPVLVRIGPRLLGGGGRDCWVFAFRHVGPSPLSVFLGDGWLLTPRRSRGIGPSR